MGVISLIFAGGGAAIVFKSNSQRVFPGSTAVIKDYYFILLLSASRATRTVVYSYPPLWLVFDASSKGSKSHTSIASMADALQVITLKVTQLSSEIQDANTRSITANSKVSEQAAVIAQLERTVSRMSMQFLVFF